MSETCAQPAHAITITKDNCIEVVREAGQKIIDWNRLYEGYYPACRFTDAAIYRELMYVAGTDEAGIPHLFSSRTGEVWTPITISSQKSLITEKDYGDLVKILFDPGSEQLFLVTKNGCLVTLPDCPKCVRARKISDIPLVDAQIDAKKITMTNAEGQMIAYSIYVAVQYRCAWSFAAPHIGKDGFVVDLQTGSGTNLPGSFRISLEDLDGVLMRLPKETYLFFVCEYGRKADEAVRDARNAGFKNSYSLGDIRSVLQEQTEAQ